MMTSPLIPTASSVVLSFKMGVATGPLNHNSTTRMQGVCRSYRISCSGEGRPVVIGLGADSGCGKTTFMKRMMSVFQGSAEPCKTMNPDSNTLIADSTTVICLDDYHLFDRVGRKERGVTALDPRANNFDLMYQQIKCLKEGMPVEKPIYNHVTGLLDPPEVIYPPNILIIEGLHPM
jgi:phosphoribulokinase